MAPARQDGLRQDQASKANSLSIVYRNIDELKLDPRNPRRHSKKQIQQIARSIEAFGFNVPCIVDERLGVINGHGRLAAARILGMERIPTICLAHLSETQRRAFQLADNRVGEKSSWNRAALAEELHILKTANLDFDLSSTGFEIEEINLMTLELELASARQPKDLDQELTNTQSEIAVSRPGDLWVLGNHRVLCGSAWDEQNYPLLMNDRCASAVLTHVPAGAGDDAELLTKLFSELAEHSAPPALQFVFTDQRFIRSLAAVEGAGLKLIDICVAVKPYPDIGAVYQSQYDLILVFGNTNAETQSKPQIHRSNVWFYPRARRRHHVSDPRRADLVQNKLPVALIADAIMDGTERGGIVLDPFLGTGTSLMAAEQTGRVCYAIESEALQLDRSLTRWQELSGKNAVHEERGMSFDQIREERHGRN